MIDLLSVISVILAGICLILSAVNLKNSDSDEVGENMYNLKRILFIVWIIVFAACCINLLL